MKHHRPRQKETEFAPDLTPSLEHIPKSTSHADRLKKTKENQRKQEQS